MVLSHNRYQVRRPADALVEQTVHFLRQIEEMLVFAGAMNIVMSA